MNCGENGSPITLFDFTTSGYGDNFKVVFILFRFFLHFRVHQLQDAVCVRFGDDVVTGCVFCDV